jgi:hypothetical protein
MLPLSRAPCVGGDSGVREIERDDADSSTPTHALTCVPTAISSTSRQLSARTLPQCRPNRKVYGGYSQKRRGRAKSYPRRMKRTVPPTRKTLARPSPPTKNVSKSQNRCRCSARTRPWKIYRRPIYSTYLDTIPRSRALGPRLPF